MFHSVTDNGQEDETNKRLAQVSLVMRGEVRKGKGKSSEARQKRGQMNTSPPAFGRRA